MLELENILRENSDKIDVYRRNLLKDYLQVLVLKFIFSQKKYQELVFYGGSALSQCHALPRLSEDLDFVDLEEKVDLAELAVDLREYFQKETDLPVETKVQKFRIYLKFPVLKKLGLVEIGQSEQLFLKVEIFPGLGFCRKHKIENQPIFKFGHSVLVRTFDLPTLMATKIGAVFNRRWEKRNSKGESLLSVKGRDYFDLLWYLQKRIEPNLACVETCKNMAELKKKLNEIIARVDERSIVLDLENFISDKVFVKSLGKNIKDILKREVAKLGRNKFE